MPLNIVLVGVQAFHSYYPTLKALTNSLVTLPIVCSISEQFPNVAYFL